MVLRLASLSLVVIVLLIGHQVAEAATPVTHEQLRLSVRKAIQENPDGLQPSDFRANQTTVYYRFGGHKEFLNKPMTDVLDIPTSGQFTVEAIRRYEWGPRGKAIWPSRLARAEALIGEQLDLIANHRGNQPELYTQLYERHIRCNSLFVETIRSLAEEYGRTIAPLSTLRQQQLVCCDPCTCCYVATPSIPESEDFSVKCDTQPPGGIVSYMEAGKYGILLDQQRLKESDWLYCGSGQGSPMNGVYVFRAVWTTGKFKGSTHGPKKRKISEDGTVVLPIEKPQPEVKESS